MEIKSEKAPVYAINNTDDKVISQALSILFSRLKEPGDKLTNPEDTKRFLQLKLVGLEHEVFACLFLDNRHRIISYDEMFRGTIDGATVFPREVVKTALKYNAAACILAHNHPSGDPEPSQADKAITNKLKDALDLVDVRILDHIIVGGTETISMAERGLI